MAAIKYSDIIGYDQQEKIKELLMWKSVKKINDNTIELSDGTLLYLKGNEGCGGCSSGWYELNELNEVPNAITNVEFEDAQIKDGYWEAEGCYRIFVYAENQKIKLAEFEGSDGNGYYGSGYWIYILRKDEVSD